MGHSVSPISNFEVDPSEDVTGRVPLQIFKGINYNLQFVITSLQFVITRIFSIFVIFPHNNIEKQVKHISYLLCRYEL
jgi:hypothetical protein